MHHTIAIMAEGTLFFAAAMTNMLNMNISTFSTSCSSDCALCYKFFISYQLNAQNFFIHITLHSSTCFEQYRPHPQEVKLHVYSIWYRHSL